MFIHNEMLFKSNNIYVKCLKLVENNTNYKELHSQKEIKWKCLDNNYVQ